MIEPLKPGMPPAAISLPNKAERSAGKDFEAVLLTGFIENMLPANMGGTEIDGPGAGIWRSFLAAAVADQLAGRNVTGLSGIISNSLVHSRDGDQFGA